MKCYDDWFLQVTTTEVPKGNIKGILLFGYWERGKMWIFSNLCCLGAHSSRKQHQQVVFLHATMYANSSPKISEFQHSIKPK
jgi:hypothetical protein